MGFGSNIFQAARITIDGVTIIENINTGKMETVIRIVGTVGAEYLSLQAPAGNGNYFIIENAAGSTIAAFQDYKTGTYNSSFAIAQLASNGGFSGFAFEVGVNNAIGTFIPFFVRTKNNILDNGAGKMIPIAFQMTAGAGAGLVLSSDATGNGSWAALLANAITCTSANSSLTLTQVLNNIDFSLNMAHSNIWAVKQTFANIDMTGKVTKYNNVATAGVGMNSILAVGRLNAQAAAVPSVATYTVGANDGSFLVTANVNVTASTAHDFEVQVQYTDETSTVKVMPFVFMTTTPGTTIWDITDSTGVDAYCAAPLYIRCKANSVITLLTAGTFTTVTYNVEGAISQIA
jgi:hypothetical protein